MEQKENRNAEIEEARRNEDRKLLKKILDEQVSLRLLEQYELTLRYSLSICFTSFSCILLRMSN